MSVLCGVQFATLLFAIVSLLAEFGLTFDRLEMHSRCIAMASNVACGWPNIRRSSLPVKQPAADALFGLNHTHNTVSCTLYSVVHFPQCILYLILPLAVSTVCLCLYKFTILARSMLLVLLYHQNRTGLHP